MAEKGSERLTLWRKRHQTVTGLWHWGGHFSSVWKSILRMKGLFWGNRLCCVHFQHCSVCELKGVTDTVTVFAYILNLLFNKCVICIKSIKIALLNYGLLHTFTIQNKIKSTKVKNILIITKDRIITMQPYNHTCQDVITNTFQSIPLSDKTHSTGQPFLNSQLRTSCSLIVIYVLVTMLPTRQRCLLQSRLDRNLISPSMWAHVYMAWAKQA